MLFDWDPNKRESNLAKHKLDLARGMELFDGRPVFSYPSFRDNEHRSVNVGFVADDLVAVVWMERDGAIRLILLMRARDAEKRSYRARFG